MLAASFWLPLDISTHGSRIDQLIEVLHYFMGTLFVGWGIFFAYCLLKFRAKGGRTASYAEIKAKPSKYAEVMVIAIEALLLIGLSMPVWAAYRNEPPKPDDNPLVVRVVAQQFAWNMHYPGPDGKFGRCRPDLIDETTNPLGLDDSDPAAADDVTTINNFYIPKNRKVLVRLSSKDVIHSFAVPLLRVKQDAMPGMEIPVWFEATATNDEVRERETKMVALPADEADIEDFLVRHRRKIVMADIPGGQGGAPRVAKGKAFSEDVIKTLIAAGVKEVALAPSEPVNIQCAQLCGLGHYRMLGQMQILEPAAFEEWYASANAEEEFIEE